MGEVLEFPKHDVASERDRFMEWMLRGVRRGWVDEPMIATGVPNEPGECILLVVRYRGPGSTTA